MQSSPQPNNLFDTQRGIDVRLIAAGERLRLAEDAYWTDPTDRRNRDEYLAAQEELRQLRAVPMQSLAPAREKRFVSLREA